MHSDFSDTAKELLALAEDKLTYLLALKKTLEQFCDNIEKYSGAEILLQLDTQSKHLELIRDTDNKYQAITGTDSLTYPGSPFWAWENSQVNEIPGWSFLLDTKLKISA